MTWIFGSFLVTPCALASCYILISKQEDDSTIRTLRYSRCEMRTTRADLDRVQRMAVECGTHSRSETSLMSLPGGASVGTPWLLEEDMGRRSPLSEICLSIYLLTNNKPWAL